MNLNIKLDEKAILPSRAHVSDAGLDLKSPYKFRMPPMGCAIVDTGVHVELPHGTYGAILSKSGLNMRKNIIVETEGVIDSGFTGSIKVKLRNMGQDGYIFERGDKIAQLVIIPVLIPNELIIVEELSKTERGDNDLGSSGR